MVCLFLAVLVVGASASDLSSAAAVLKKQSHMVMAAMPLGELELVLTRAKLGAECHMDEACKSDFGADPPSTGGIEAYASFVESLPSDQQGVLQSGPIHTLRTEVFQPILDKFHDILADNHQDGVHAFSLLDVTAPMMGCVNEAETAAGKLACEASSLVEMTKTFTDHSGLPTQFSKEGTDDLVSSLNDIFKVFKSVKQDLLGIRKHEDHKSSEKEIIRQHMNNFRQKATDEGKALEEIPGDMQDGIENGNLYEQEGEAPKVNETMLKTSTWYSYAYRLASLKHLLKVEEHHDGCTHWVIDHGTNAEKFDKKHGKKHDKKHGKKHDKGASLVEGDHHKKKSHKHKKCKKPNRWRGTLMHNSPVQRLFLTTPPGDHKVWSHLPITQNYIQPAARLNYSYSKINNIDFLPKYSYLQGRFHRWSQINGLSMYYEDVTQYNDRAICVDGSRARMYYAPANAENAKNWHFYMQGGYFCFDKASCNRRCQLYKEHCSTFYWWEKSIKMGGLFDPSKNVKMAGWHHAFGGYCTSDAWMGDTQLTDFDAFQGDAPGKTSYLRGHQALRANLKALIQKGLGKSKGHTFFVSGCSAGGIGLVNSIDHLKRYLKEEGAKHPVTLIAAMDVAVLVIGGRATNTEWGKTNFEEQTKRAWKNLKINYLYPIQMKKTLPLHGVAKEFAFAPWRLLLGEFRIPLIVTPHLQVTTIDDDFALAVTLDKAHGPPFAPTQEMYFADYRERMYRVLERIDVTTAREGGYYSGVFAFRCFWHCVIENDSMFRLRITAGSVEDPEMGNMAFSDVVNGFLDKKSGMWAVDHCEYFDCSCMSMVPEQPWSKTVGFKSWKYQSNPYLYEKLELTKRNTSSSH